MYETVTVDDALVRGRRMVNYPVTAMLFLLIIASFLVVFLLQLPLWLLAITVPAAIILPWLYWSFMITRWRLWAFENVRNVHELKKRAIKEKLIWADGKFFEKTEIRSSGEKEKWADLQSKFKLEDIFHDDYAVPPETKIYYSKTKSSWEVILGIGLFSLGVYFFVTNGLEMGACVCWIAGIVLAIVGYRQLKNRDAQITLSNDGVTTSELPFCSWAKIINEDVRVVRIGRTHNTYFVYTCSTTENKISINELGVSNAGLEKLLRIYRGRFNQNNGNKNPQF